MIEQLHERTICDDNGNAYGIDAPSHFEMMEKINELVEAVNKLLEEKEE